MKDSRERFSATAELYSAHRPSYPTEVIDWILTTARLVPGRGQVVVDLGCGTGISTRLLGGRGLEVIGVDPNEAMLAEAKRLGGARYRRGEAAATGLEGASVDLVTVAQAFHWFDLDATLAELGRILRPGGHAAAFWNQRGPDPFMDAYQRLLLASSTEYAGIRSPDATMAALRRHPAVKHLTEAGFGNVQLLDRAGFHGRVHSSSYVAHGVADVPAFDRALEALFERHQRDGRVAFTYRVTVLAWQV